MSISVGSRIPIDRQRRWSFNRMKKNLTITSVLSGLFLFGVSLLIGISIYPYNEAQQARFNVDALGRYLLSAQAMGSSQIRSLQALPDFEIISTSKSLSLKSKDIRDGKIGSYQYDLTFPESGGFVLSASPVGVFSSKEEFGMTEEGILKYNNKRVDPEPDSYAEVTGWQNIENERVLTTKVLNSR